MSRSLFITILATNLFTALSAQTSLKAIGLQYGPYKVGYSYQQTIDSTRTYRIKNEYNNLYGFRPIPISIWYPAETGNSSQSLSILNYLEVLKAEEEWPYLPNTFLLDWFSYLWNTPANREHLSEACKGVRNATPLSQKFPVVVYAPSYQASSIENFALCENLASHGYVVISSPSRGTDNRKLQGGTTIDMETQSRDVQWLIKESYKLPFANPDQIALMGFSFGGLSNAITVMKDRRIKALISLDGTERYNFDVLKASPYFDLERFDIPYVHMAQKLIPESVLKEDQIPEELNYEFKLYDSLKRSSIQSLRFHKLSHSYFSSYGVLFNNRDPRQDTSDKEIMESYKIMSEQVLMSLNAFIKKDTMASQFMKNPPNNNGFVEVLTSKNIIYQPFDYKSFNSLAFKQNFKSLIPLYEDSFAKHPELELQESMLNLLGLKLSFDPERNQQGIKVLEFALYLYPQSANLYDSIAEAYLYGENYNQAIAHFKKSLALDPQNENAIKRLEQLEN